MKIISTDTIADAIAQEPGALLQILGVIATAHEDPVGDEEVNLSSFDNFLSRVATAANLSHGCLCIPHFLRQFADVVESRMRDQVAEVHANHPEFFLGESSVDRHLYLRLMNPVPVWVVDQERTDDFRAALAKRAAEEVDDMPDESKA
ncbi:hypothetical protein [Rhodobacter ferrooxidans]|uniref:Uncharacterized protein n=1 Tax=Rhodobacter ferrooxidans TaxID=371731 RepID=C8RXK1_9RHOB|nr:hypothetical protein [Rhodobacter sp. SW2]EEW26726.1 hypothetical protein Rsw2DRAFT_0529 [Rhodobacter sp. SW2]